MGRDRMSVWKPAYLVHGDDHGRIGERRANLRRKAEEEAGAQGVEVFDADAATPAAVAVALSAMTFSIGHRFLVVDGVERWKDADVKTHVLPALKAMDPGTTIAFFGRDDGRIKTPATLVDAVGKAGGVVGEEVMLKAKDLPRWVAAEGAKLGLTLGNPAARVLVEAVGERQQRLLRELEKLALEHGPGTAIGVEEVQESCAGSAERKLWTLADALVAGDGKGATRALLELREQGERLPGLLYGMVRRLRDALAIAEALAAGQQPAQIKRGLRMPGFAADRLIADAGRRDVESYRRGLELMADLELESRGGGGGVLDESTAAVRAVIAAAS